MTVTGITARLAPYLYDDAVINGSASGLTLINPGDWVIWSARWVIAAHDATVGSPAYRTSAAGVALDPNPKQYVPGTWATNNELAILRRGVLRVTAGESGTAGTLPMGSYAYPNTTGSGINGLTGGNTGATGLGAIWNTAAPVAASGTGQARPSGVAVIIAEHGQGDATGWQWDIVVNLATNVGLF